MKLADRIILTLLMLLVFRILTHSQPISEPIYQEAAKSERNENHGLTLLNDEIYLRQVGIDNKAFIIQSSPMNMGNSAIIGQFGQSTDIVLSQLGTSNSAELHQNGFTNSINITERGDFISSKVLQFGLHNTVHQELGADKTDHLIIQKGYNHKVSDLGFNSNSPGYTIKQEGMVGMSVIIK